MDMLLSISFWEKKQHGRALIIKITAEKKQMLFVQAKLINWSIKIKFLSLPNDTSKQTSEKKNNMFRK